MPFESKPGSSSSTPLPDVHAPAISLPKGGGAIRSVGEKFAAHPVTGTGAMTLPIALSPGRSGFGPMLSLDYDSGAGNGPFGFGWKLSLPSITRKTDRGLPQYMDAQDTDVFLLSGAEDLVPAYRQNPDGSWVRDQEGRLVVQEDDIDGYRVRRYRPRIESLFARIERWTRIDAPGDVHWRTLSKENILTLYGRDAASRIADPLDARRIFSWLICETRDDKGNAVLYRYKAEDGLGVDQGQAHERNRGPRDDVRRTANRYLKRILYGNRTPLLHQDGRRPRFLGAAQIENAGWMFEAVFDYGDHDPLSPLPRDDEAADAAGGRRYPWALRSDPFSSYRAGFEVRTARLCRRVLMFHHFPEEDGIGADCLVRSTDFSHSGAQHPDEARNPVYSFLRAATQTGYKRADNGGYVSRSLPPVEFDYTEPEVQDIVEDVDPASLQNLPIGLDGSVYRWADLHGEGIPGILTEQAGAWFYKRNLSPVPAPRPDGREQARAHFAPVETVAVRPNAALAAHAEFMDLAGDGQPDLVLLEGAAPGFYEHDEEEGWLPFRPFSSRINHGMRDPNLRFVDLDGDGHADVLITEDDAFVWHASLAEEGFGPARRVAQALDEEKGPRVVFADGMQSIHLADLSGDGLTDVVRIRNGEVCYWPNLGYGRFGAKITMNHAPHFDRPDQFDPARIRLADIDGSGTTDLIYLHRDGIRLYFNQSGNGWSPPRLLNVFPQTDDAAGILPADLLGNGTACLVWSSPLPGNARRQMRYINLMGDRKPHLLAATRNNLGVETRIEYAPSTRFYLQDKLAGTPWVTRLPFPVHVVERVTTIDHISRNRFVSRFAYHHGYFDSEEREFHGFGMVEQWDTEQMAALAGGDAPAGNIAAESHVPPVHTKTWFHTGMFAGRDRVSDYFAGLRDADDKGEYYREPGLTDAQARALLLSDTVLPPGLSLEEEREACRALKGLMLRREVYADDAPPSASEAVVQRAGTPYNVAEQNFSIRFVQPRGENRHAVFFTQARETLTYHYERHPTDPRVQHVLTLETDAYGNVLKEATIGYGRRQPDATLPQQADRDRQTRALITYIEHRVTNAIDDIAAHSDAYRTPLPAQSRTFELTGLSPENGAIRFDFEEWVRNDFALARSASEIPYEQAASHLTPQKRLIEQVRTLYRPDDLGISHNDDPSALLPVGMLQTLAAPGESYKLAFTPGLVAQVFQRDGQPLLPAPGDVLGGQDGDQGGYVDLDGDGHWWLPAGRTFLSPDANHGAAEELAHARHHFFLPHRHQDPFGKNSTLVLDAYDLLIRETRDTMDNRITVGERMPNGAIDPAIQGNDYRLLQPCRLMDANRNRTQVAFDILGMVAGTAIMGKPEEHLGDTLDGVAPDLDETAILEHFADPLAAPHALLGRATTRLVYDLFAYQRSKHQEAPQPAGVATLTRETHDAALAPGEQTRIQHNFSYTDGFGREIQKKMQAESGPLVPGAPDAAPRWVGSGWTIFNNKGKPVRKYEPFFSLTHRFESGVQNGISPILFYDPIERVVATLHPNNTYEKVVFDAWQQTVHDVNDTVAPAGTETGDPRTDPHIAGYVAAYFDSLPPVPGQPWQTWYQQRQSGALGPQEQTAAVKAAAHAGTPTSTHFDAQGRAFLTVARNRVVCPDHPLDGTDGEFATRIELDIEGNRRAVRDAIEQAGDPLGRLVMRYAYDMLGNLIHQASMDAGARWMLSDASGNLIRSWDSRGHNVVTRYDALRRPFEQRVRGTAADSDPRTLNRDLLVDRIEYGEALPGAEALNLRTRIYRHFDSAGVATNARLDAGGVPIEGYDFKGNLLRTTRCFIRDYNAIPDWSQNPAQEDERFESGTRYDALNRPIQSIAPHSNLPHAKHNIIQPVFNEASLLERVDVWLERDTEPGALLDPALEPPSAAGIDNIDYDAKGQRQRIDYRNGTSTFYDYDPLTFRLSHLRTRRNAAAFPLDCQQPPPAGWPGCQVQNLRYTYDAVGNITRIQDDAQQAVYFSNKRVEPSNDYTYDALYRLIQAGGREHLAQGGAPIPHSPHDAGRVGLAHPNDGNAMGTYIERYVYDAVGNFLAMQHRGSDPAHPGWTRAYAYAETSLIENGIGSPPKTGNRLSGTTLNPEGGNPVAEPYLHDAHGNMTRMPHLGGGLPGPNLHWDYRDRLRRADLGGGGTACHVYDASGLRVRKVLEKTPGLVEERIYLGGFEIFRRHGGAIGTDTATLERETLHVMDDRQRIALVETRTRDTAGTDPAPRRLIRYQHGNHLGSSSLELDDAAQIISYEEYTPFGSTSCQAVRSQTETAKRYRYAGKERDEESGLQYYGARYYMPWLGRWAAPDPILFDAPPQTSATRGPDHAMEAERSVEAGDANASPDSEAQGDRQELGERGWEPYAFSYCNPVIHIDPNGKAPVKVGYIYTLRAKVNGQDVVYSGQTARELAQRLYKDKHKWSSVIKDVTTTIEAHEVRAELNVAESSRKSLASAKKEALSAAEQVVVKRRRAEIGLKELNSIEAAEEANITKWADRHAVRLGPRFTFRAGAKVGAFAGFLLLDVFMMYRDEKLSRYVMAPYFLEDEQGVFTLREKDRGIFRRNHYFKVYQTGPLAGQKVRISKDEFMEWKEEGELLWGRVDWKGDWVPGLLRRELPVVDYCTANPDLCA